MDTGKIIKEFIAKVNELSETKEATLYYWTLGVDKNNNRWAIVLGWQDGYDICNDKYADGTFRLCAKLAFQPANSAMQCDFDVDWEMPYDESGEVDDTETAFYGNYDIHQLDCVVRWLLAKYTMHMDKMLIKEIWESPDYYFECNIDDDYIKENHYEWGVAQICFGNIGVEYNYCVQSGDNYSAIYKMKENTKTGFFDTDTDEYVHYEIDPQNPNWRKELELSMCMALIDLHGLGEEI